ncbi:MAG: methionine adenosyltransferase [Clostridiales bacterium]|nr:methionine adenosyltransferase [Clostridiales bacterium]
MKRLFTSESVTEGHPDKICDQVSDAILDAILAQDKNARVACECSCTTNFLLIMGEITTMANVDVEKVARETIKNIGYDSDECGFNYQTCQIKVLLNKQSPDIAMGVNDSLESKDTNEMFSKVGAGDQGMMYGYATDETQEYMPLSILLSHRLCQKLAKVRKEKIIDYLRPDGKAQVTVEYKNNKINRIDTIVVSAQHHADVDIEVVRKDIMEKVIKPTIDSDLIDEDTKFFINPTGRFVIGGPMGDSGLTGRKIIVDTYGGYVPHGGGCFSGKDPTKVDRSAAYYARYVAKNLVASGVCNRCEICVAYAIGKANPVSIDINSFGTSKVGDEKLVEIVKKVFDFRPQAIINNLSLNQPIYAKSASYGHFGREIFSWEKLDKIKEIKAYLAK